MLLNSVILGDSQDDENTPYCQNSEYGVGGRKIHSAVTPQSATTSRHNQ
jgi:hypothetical protein